MQRCPNCKVTVAGHKACCPLCGGRLSGPPAPDTEVFPSLEKPRFTGSFALRLLGLLAIAVTVVCLLVNLALGMDDWWWIFVAVGAACVWSAAAVGIAYRRDIAQNIGWQVLLIPALSVLWDIWTGWRGWSADFVLPCVCAVGLLAMLLFAVLFKMPVRAFAGPFIGACVLGIVPAVLVACGVAKVKLPSLVCTGLAVVLLAALLLFQWQTIKAELQRRFHL